MLGLVVWILAKLALKLELGVKLLEVKIQVEVYSRQGW
jgi:hypothetical protein